MDYEKKYNEALAIAKETYETQPVYRAWLEKMFPELRESRIRMALCDIIRDMPYMETELRAHGLTVEKTLAYLEKQKNRFESGRGLYYYDGEKTVYVGYPATEEKEQKPAEINVKALLAADRLASAEMTGRLKERSEILENPERYGLQKPAEWSEKHIADIFEKVGLAKIAREQGNDALTNAIQSAMIELSKVGNTEWSEDYQEENIQTRFAFYTYKDDPSTLYLSNVFVEEASRNHGFGTRILKAAEKVAETIGAITISLKVKQDSPANAWYRKNGYGYVTFEDGYDWLEKNLEYLKPNKSEWSEEDEEHLTRIDRALVILETNSPHINTADDRKWLKFLRPQPQKLKDWTEEDERKYQCIRSILLADADKKIGSWKYSEILEWYEKRDIGRYTNSESHWKPSEEQEEPEYYQHFDPDC